MKYEEYQSMLDGLGYRMREVVLKDVANDPELNICLLYTSPSPRDA